MLILTVKEVNMTIEKQARPAIDSDLNELIQAYANGNFNGNFTKAVNSMIRSFIDDDDDNLGRLSYMSIMIEGWFDSRLSQNERKLLCVDVPLSNLVRDLFDVKGEHTWAGTTVKCEKCDKDVTKM